MIPVDVTSVDLTEVTGPIAVGAEIQLDAVIAPADASNQDLVFESDDPSIATVTESGVLTALAEGMVTVKVTTDDGGFTDSQLIHILSPSTEFNWALGQPVMGTGTPGGNNVDTNLVDNNTSTRWSVNEYPQSATVDLEGDIKINQIEVTCHEGRAYQFIIEGASQEDGPYTTIVDRSTNTIRGTATVPIINDVDEVEARFVRITVSGADMYTGTWVSLTELRVFGEGERTYQEEEEEEITEFLLTPNPARAEVTIQAPEAYHTVSMYDTSGKRIFQQEINQVLTLDISVLHAGLYIIKIEGNNMSELQKLIKY